LILTCFVSCTYELGGVSCLPLSFSQSSCRVTGKGSASPSPSLAHITKTSCRNKEENKFQKGLRRKREKTNCRKKKKSSKQKYENKKKKKEKQKAKIRGKIQKGGKRDSGEEEKRQKVTEQRKKDSEKEWKEEREMQEKSSEGNKHQIQKCRKSKDNKFEGIDKKTTFLKEIQRKKELTIKTFKRNRTK
jgi:hypothetical protein